MSRRTRKHAVHTLVLFTTLLVAAAPTPAQSDYPNRTIRLVVPAPPGSLTDINTRLIAQSMSASLGQSIVIDNRLGAGGNIGTDFAAKSKPDGYTLLILGTSQTVTPALVKDVPFDVLRDFAPVGAAYAISNILLVHPSVPAKTVAELIALAKAKPGSLSYASTGLGGSTHLSGELFKLVTGTNIVHIPYKIGPQAGVDLRAGRIPMMFDNAPSAAPHVNAGTQRALASTGRARSKLLPDVPTFAELGLPGVVVEGWGGLSVPTGTPRPVIERLNAELNKALAAPELRKALEDRGNTVLSGTPEAFGSFVASEIEKWAKLVKAANITAE